MLCDLGMKKKFQFIILIFLTSCSTLTDENSNDTLFLEKIVWENEDRDFVVFDSTLIYVPIKDYTTCSYNFKLYSDTLKIINKTINAYNVKNFKDTISLLKVKYLKKDSIEFIILNEGAKELFGEFSSMKFFNSSSLDRFKYYREKDERCKNEIDSALKNIEANKYVVCRYNKWNFRNEKEFIQLLADRNIGYVDLGPPPDVLPIERNCFRETMDYYINKKLGDKYVEKLLHESDSVMLKNSRDRVFEYWECDVGPVIDGKRDYNDISVETELPVKEYRKEWAVENGKAFAVYHPFIDLQFKIDTTGELSDFRIGNFVTDLDWNEQFKNQLFGLGIQKIKSLGKWRCGLILGQKVNTYNNVRVEFIRKEN